MYILSQNVGNTLGIRWPYAIHTLAIRQLYARCMLNTLLNRPAYAKMSIYVADTLQIRCRYVADTLQIRCRYVADTSEVCYSCAINALSWPWWWYHTIAYRTSVCQRIKNYHSYAGIRQWYVRHRLYTFQARCHTLAYVDTENYFQSCLCVYSDVWYTPSICLIR